MNIFSKSLVSAFLLLYAVVTLSQQTHAQSFRIVTVNTFTGALTGTALGGATIALQDKSEIDYYPLRFGVGLGTIMGLGTGLYDLSHMTGSSGIYVDGFISSANSTGTIILLDTFYGASTGAIVGTAISLMSRESDIVKGIQYGAGAGAWIGFAFGLVDAFLLSTTGDYDSFYDNYSSSHRRGINGLIEIRGNNNNYAIGFLNPVIVTSRKLSDRDGITSNAHLGFEFTRVNIAL